MESTLCAFDREPHLTQHRQDRLPAPVDAAVDSDRVLACVTLSPCPTATPSVTPPPCPTATPSATPPAPAVPRAAPTGLLVDGKTSSSAKLKWKGVSTSDLRGKLIHYTVIVRHDNSVLQRLQTNRTSVEVTGLNKFALHHVQVFAETSAGPGPHAFLYLFTEAAGA